MTTHDQHNDPALVTAAALARQAPDYVKTAGHDDLYASDKLPSVVFAGAGEFPCHTAAATWLSAGFFQRNRAGIKQASAIEQRLLEFADFHGIKADIQKLLGPPAPVKEASVDEAPDEEFGYIGEENGTKVRRFRLRNSAEIKAAAAYLDRYTDQIPAAMRRTIATRALVRAEKLACNDDGACGCLACHAGLAVAPAGVLSDELRNRAALAHSSGKADISAQLNEVADNVTKDAAHGRRSTGIIVEVLEAVDQEQGWTPLYGQLLRKPADLLAVTAKVATDAAADYVELSTGSVYLASDLSKLALDQVRDTFGDDLADAVTCLNIGAREGRHVHVDAPKLAAEAHALPRPDAVALENLLREAGVEPLRKQASTGGWLRDRELQELVAV